MKKYGTVIVYLLIALLVVALISGGITSEAERLEIGYEDFVASVREGKVQNVMLSGRDLYGRYIDSEIPDDKFPDKFDFYCYVPTLDVFHDDMATIASELTSVPKENITSADYSFGFDPQPVPEASWFEMLLPYLLLIVVFAVFYYFLMQSQGGGNKMMSFGKSRARTQNDPHNKTTFADVAGVDEEKEELMEVVEFMRSPRRFTEMGARIPKGVLLVGPPGTGKTLLAKAVAGEAKVPFYSISGSDFVEMFVGVGASRVRDLFTTAKRTAPAVIFIDEIDAVGRQRGAGLGGGHDEREQTLNQLLVEMDGFAVNEGIIIIAATNRPDILDPALLRPGRFDRQITVGYPDVKGREQILGVHAKGKRFSDDVDLRVLAKLTPGFTGADLENVLNEAAILSARYKKKFITMVELEEAITRVIVGPEKRSRVITPEDKRITAYHEAGHAIVAYKLPHADPVHEVSVIPRGMAAGYTLTMPEKDDNHTSRSKILDAIAMLLGGRVAEEVALDDISTGASNDLERATELARRMVMEFGMSDSIGPVSLSGGGEVFIAKDWGHQRNYSEDVAARVDAEVRRILDEQYNRAKDALSSDRAAMDRVVDSLIEYERITGEEFEKIYRNEAVELISYRTKQEELHRADPEVVAAEEKERLEREAALEALRKQDEEMRRRYGETQNSINWEEIERSEGEKKPTSWDEPKDKLPEDEAEDEPRDDE